jgi:hypothetical protein
MCSPKRDFPFISLTSAFFYLCQALIIMSKPRDHPDPGIPAVFVSEKAGIIMRKLITPGQTRVRIVPVSTSLLFLHRRLCCVVWRQPVSHHPSVQVPVPALHVVVACYALLGMFDTPVSALSCPCCRCLRLRLRG